MRVKTETVAQVAQRRRLFLEPRGKVGALSLTCRANRLRPQSESGAERAQLSDAAASALRARWRETSRTARVSKTQATLVDLCQPFVLARRVNPNSPAAIPIKPATEGSGTTPVTSVIAAA